MIKHRLIPKLLLKRSRFLKNRMVLVTSVKFANHVEIGDPVSQAKIYQDQMADELLFLDIDATSRGRDVLLLEILKNAAGEIFMPLTVGGGVKDIGDFRTLLLNGADKVSINTAALENPDLINEASGIFGSQCVVVSIDARLNSRGGYCVYKNSATVEIERDPVSWAVECEKRGAGEILLTSVDNDGSRSGLDHNLTRQVAESVSIPVIASGGVGLASHFVDGFINGKADAVSAGTYFCFRDENPMQARSQVKSASIPIRIFT